ncbi:hypothetical protein PAPYR_13200 [Paratrimastix pyriformis]|uniref:Uncharacterized protein n=1 Tax=Paratrimastix pyriformis TaxID=342808 RepID=A0ABQ8U0M2_9EUKA|nr:hypothetical protein PAPYR_13200 [Paratrimastix pyriformis]
MPPRSGRAVLHRSRLAHAGGYHPAYLTSYDGAQVPTGRPLRHVSPPGIPPDPGAPQTQAPGGPLGALPTGSV